MFKFLESVPTPIALNAAHQAVRLLQRRVEPTVSRSKLLIKGLKSSPSQQEFKIARQIVREVQDAEGQSIRRVTPTRVQKYVVQLADIMQERLSCETKVEPGRAENLLANLKQYEPMRVATPVKRVVRPRRKTARGSR